MRFRYLADPLFLGCLVLYFLNRFLIKHLVAGGFFHDHLNDLICIPFWVPIMVFLLRKVGLRSDDGPPRADEILVPLVMWSAIFEIYLPHVKYFERLAVADYTDILWYTIGALAASVIWQVTYRGEFGDIRLNSPHGRNAASPASKGIPNGWEIRRVSPKFYRLPIVWAAGATKPQEGLREDEPLQRAKK